MSWKIIMYNHNSQTEGITQVKTRFYAFGFESQYDKTWNMLSSWGSSGSQQSGIPWGSGTQIWGYVTGIEEGYNVYFWRVTVSPSSGSSESMTKYSTDLSLDWKTSYGDSGTVHIWPAAVWVGIDEPEPEPTWTLKYGETTSNLFGSKRISYNNEAYSAYRFRFTPSASGVATFYTESNIDTIGYLCDKGESFDYETGVPYSYLNNPSSDDDAGNGSNFKITYNVDAGTTYDLFVRPYYTTTSGAVTLCLNPPATPTTLLTVSNMVIGRSPTFNFLHYDEYSTVNVTYDFYGLTGTIASGTSLSTYSSWTVPESFYEKIPEDTSGTITITVASYNNGIYIGSEEYTYSVAIPEDACKPTLAPVIKDVKAETLALTGDENIIVKGASFVEYALNVEVKNAATLAYLSITNGSQTIEDMPNGVIDNPEAGLFTITAIDSRGLMTTMNVEKTLIEYFTPTCYQKIRMEISGEAEVDVNGSIFAGSFGAVDNTIKIEVRHTDAEGVMGEWNDLSALMPEMNSDNTYNFHFTVSGLEYRVPYTFQCRVTDKLYAVESQQYTTRWEPIYDWSQDDFNFNVPVNIGADTLDMYGNTVLRYNELANNVVLSTGGGHIYIRPAGTNDTTGEITIYPDGRVNFSGVITVNGEVVGGGGITPADYIVEYGQEAMGSNGTWYWEKWASGKAICYGKRNYGRISLGVPGTQEFTQTLPSGLFISEPIIASPQFVEDRLIGGVDVYVTNIDKTTMDFSFFAYDTALNSDSTNIYHHVIGRWKQ